MHHYTRKHHKFYTCVYLKSRIGLGAILEPDSRSHIHGSLGMRLCCDCERGRGDSVSIYNNVAHSQYDVPATLSCGAYSGEFQVALEESCCFVNSP